MKALDIISSPAFIAPLVPASFLGFAVYRVATSVNMPVWMAIPVAVAMGAGLEGIGAKAGRQKEWWPLTVYMAIGIIATILIDWSRWNVIIVSISSFALTGLAYAVLGLEDNRQEEAKEKREAKAFNRETNRRVRLAKVAAESGKRKVETGTRVTGRSSRYDKLSRDDKLALLDMTGGQIGKRYGISRQAGNGMKRKAKAELNGAQP